MPRKIAFWRVPLPLFLSDRNAPESLVAGCSGSRYLDVKHLPAGVVAAGQAHVVRLLVGPAVGATDDVPRAELVVLATETLPGTRDTLLW